MSNGIMMRWRVPICCSMLLSSENPHKPCSSRTSFAWKCRQLDFRCSAAGGGLCDADEHSAVAVRWNPSHPRVWVSSSSSSSRLFMTTTAQQGTTRHSQSGYSLPMVLSEMFDRTTLLPVSGGECNRFVYILKLVKWVRETSPWSASSSVVCCNTVTASFPLAQLIFLSRSDPQQPHLSLLSQNFIVQFTIGCPSSRDDDTSHLLVLGPHLPSQCRSHRTGIR